MQPTAIELGWSRLLHADGRWAWHHEITGLVRLRIQQSGLPWAEGLAGLALDQHRVPVLILATGPLPVAGTMLLTATMSQGALEAWGRWACTQGRPLALPAWNHLWALHVADIDRMQSHPDVHDGMVIA